MLRTACAPAAVRSSNLRQVQNRQRNPARTVTLFLTLWPMPSSGQNITLEFSNIREGFVGQRYPGSSKRRRYRGRQDSERPNTYQGSGVKRADGCITGVGGPSVKQIVSRHSQASVADLISV